MAYNEKLAERIRERLSQLNNVEEKKMFSGVAFMVDGKMCVNVSGDDLMCRIDPLIHQEVTQRKGCRAMIMRGRELKGYVLISEEGMKTKEDFDYWMGLSLQFNNKAKASKKSKK